MFFLFKKLPDKASSLSIVFNELLNDTKFDQLLYFLDEGYCRNIDMDSLMKQACRHEHVKLVQWILENVDHTELDIKSTFFEACKCIKSFKHNKLSLIMEDKEYLHCLALIWHFIQDIDMFEIDTVLKTITEVPPVMSSKYEELRNWLQYVKNITAKRLCEYENSTLYSREGKNK